MLNSFFSAMVGVLAGISIWFGGFVNHNPVALQPTQVACTQEAKACPDGSYVGRTGTNCEFAPCPASNPIPTPTPTPIPVLTPTPTPSSTNLSATPTAGSAPLAVQFVGFGNSGANGEVLDFGDGSSKTLSFPNGMCPVGGCGPTTIANHTYTSAGAYTATLTSGNCNCPAGGTCNCPMIQILGTATITVTGSKSASTNFSASPTSGAVPLAVSFNAYGLSPDTDYTLDFGDGASASVLPAPPISAPSHCGIASGCANVSPCGLPIADCPHTYGYASHAYTSAGTYMATLWGLTPVECANGVQHCGQTTIGTATITVTGSQSSAIFSASPSSGAAPLRVDFTAKDSQGNVPVGIIDFGDGTRDKFPAGCNGSGYGGTAPIAGSCFGGQTHTYTTPGNYSAILSRTTSNCVATVQSSCSTSEVLGTASIKVFAAPSQTSCTVDGHTYANLEKLVSPNCSTDVGGAGLGGLCIIMQCENGNWGPAEAY